MIRQHSAWKADALPIELHAQKSLNRSGSRLRRLIFGRKVRVWLARVHGSELRHQRRVIACVMLEMLLQMLFAGDAVCFRLPRADLDIVLLVAVGADPHLLGFEEHVYDLGGIFHVHNYLIGNPKKNWSPAWVTLPA